jgi:hypothetical protein
LPLAWGSLFRSWRRFVRLLVEGEIPHWYNRLGERD